MTALCDNYEANGTIARYVARDLDEQEAEAFENHYLTCERCQRSIEVGWSLRTQPAQARPRYMAAKSLLLTAAAACVVLLAVRGVQRGNLRALGILQTAPIYIGAETRGTSDDAAAFVAAMNAYNAGRYREAAATLANIETDGGDPVVPFFRGASFLMLRNARAAAEEFTKVIDAGPSVYRAEAYYYRGKAELLEGLRADAISDLRNAASQQSSVNADATRLLQKLSN